MKCEECNGQGGWWLNRRGQRIYGVPWPTQAIAWMSCQSCIGGTSHCCEGERPDCAPDKGQNNG